ncbi:MAG: hypothetical protein V3T20_09415 [Gemmatimonadota bacterium]
MSRTLAGVLVGLMVVAFAGAAAAGIPDPDNSKVYLGDETGDDLGMCSCPAGDGPVYEYITVEAKRVDGTPIQGIAYGSFFFTVTGGDVTITHVDDETNSVGMIRFDMVADETINAGPHTIPPSDPLAIECQIYTVVLNDGGDLEVNSFDIDGNGTVGLSDFGIFSSLYLGTDRRGDFDWNGTVGLSDFGLFSAHYLH